MRLTRDATNRILKRISHAFQESFTIIPRTQDGDPGTVDTWYQLLKDLDTTHVLSAVMDILTDDREKPPRPGQVRTRAVQIASGNLNPIPPMMAWERAQSFCHGKEVKLTNYEQRALNTIGGTFVVKGSKKLAFERAAFVRHYEEMQRFEERYNRTVPEIARTARMMPLPTPERTLPAPRESPVNRPTREQVGKFLKGLKGYDPNQWEKDVKEIYDEDL